MMHWLKIEELTRVFDEAEVVGSWHIEHPREYEVQSLRRMAHTVKTQSCLPIHEEKPNLFVRDKTLIFFLFFVLTNSSKVV